MTEAEYIHVRHLGGLEHAASALRSICASNSKIIDPGEFQAIQTRLALWIEGHYENPQCVSDDSDGEPEPLTPHG